MLTVLQGDALTRLRELPDCSVQCCVTSPPYWGLRDYGCTGQLGLEKTPEEYVANMAQVFREVWRVLRDDGTLWLNLGDSYVGGGRGGANGDQVGDGTISGKAHAAGTRWGKPTGKIEGLKCKDLVGVPWMVAFALRSDGWYLRSDIIWCKPNPMPESVTDRPTKSHEYLFLLSKNQRYYYDAEAIKEPMAEASTDRYAYMFGGKKSEALVEASINGIGQRTRIVGRRRPNGLSQVENKSEPLGFDNTCGVSEDGTRNKRSVWTVNTHCYRDAHFATYPPDLIKPCILAGSQPGDTILDPFGGSGTTGMVALELGRKAVLVELNAEYVKLIERRCDVTPGLALA